MAERERVIVLLSGGIDSAVCLWLAKERGAIIHTITYNYYARQKREIIASEALARAANAEHRSIDLPFLREFEDIDLYTTSPLHLEKDTTPRVYIPSRNLIFYSIAASLAEVIGARKIIGGHHSEDVPNFPDAGPGFFKVLNEALALGSRASRTMKIEIVAPLLTLDKTGVIAEALRLKIPLELTWSCQRREDLACGECPSCRSRLDSFHQLGIKDPIEYLPPNF